MKNELIFNRIEFEELEELEDLIDTLYIPEKDLLDQFPKEILMFIHFRTVGRERMGEKVDGCSLVNFKKILNINKKISTDRHKITKELLEYLGHENEGSSIKNLDIGKIFDENYNINSYYYRALRELYEELWEQIFLGSSEIEDNDIQNKLVQSAKKYLISEAPAYNTTVLICLFKNVLPLINSESFEGKALPSMRFALGKLLIYQNEIQNKFVNMLIKNQYSLNEAKNEIKRKNTELVNYKNIIKEITKYKRSLEKRIENNQKIHSCFNNLNNFKNTLEIKKEDISKILNEIQNLNKEIVNVTYNNIIDKLNNRVADLKTALNERSREYNNLKKDYKLLTNKSIYSELKKYIQENGFTKQLRNIVLPYLSEIKYEVEQNSEKCDNYIVKGDLIGYCALINDKHFVKFPNGESIELKNLPEEVYLKEGQVLLVSNEGDFKFSYKYTCLGIELHPLVELSIIKYIYNNTYKIGTNDSLTDLKNVPKNIKLRLMQAIIVDKEKKYIRSLPKFSLNADSLLPSMKLKGHTPYFVVKIYQNGVFLLRDIVTGMELEKKILNIENDIKLHSVISINSNDELISCFHSGRFYTMSSYYDRFRYGLVEFKDNVAYLKIIKEDKLIEILDMPDNIDLQGGMVIKVDEFGSFISLVNSELEINKKPTKIYKSNDVKIKNDIIDITKNILILGNIAYENSYKLSFLKKGYNALVLDGYEPWNRVLREIKNKDLVVLTTKFVSHENMYEIKKIEQPTIFSDLDGANRLVEEVEKYFNSNENI